MKILIGKYKATIYPEGKGYTGAISLGYGPDGKRRRPKRKGKTEAEVKNKLIEIVDELQKGVKPDHRYRVEDAVNDFLRAIDTSKRSPATKEVYRRLADHQIIPYVGKTRLGKLTPGDVETWLEGRAEHLTSTTLGITHGLLKRAIRRAARHDKVSRNVAELVDLPEGKPGRQSRSLTLEQAQAVIDEARKPEHRIGAYVILAIVSGLRTEELRSLRWNMVDLDKATVYVLRADRHKGETKTKLSRRGIGIAAIAVGALKALRKQQAAERLNAGSVYNDQDFVFCHEDGSPYTAPAVRRRFRKLVGAAGLEPEEWTPRELRHTFVSILSDHGVPTQKISDLVGHKDTKVTETVYRHLLRPEIRDGAEHMNDIFTIKNGKSA